MPSHRDPLLAAPHKPTPLFKLAIVLLVLVQIIAPSWHVCELGGYTCHSGSHQEHAGHAKVKFWTPECGGGPTCACVMPPGATLNPTGQVLDGRDVADHGTCLALLLMSMPGALALAFALALFSAPRRTRALPALLPPSVALLSQPPARGPPHLSFA